MARTTADEVKAVLAPGRDYDLRGNPSLLPFIDTASILIDKVDELAEGTYPAKKLKLMEMWLSAHFYKQSDKDFSSRSTSGASGSFAGKTDMGLNSTLYGQSAQALDTEGYLSEIGGNGPVEVGGVWLGTPASQQRTSEERS